MASYPTNDSEFSDWLNTFITVANNSLATSGLTAADITALQATKANFDARLAAEDVAKQAAIGATAAKKLARRDANAITSARVNMVLANPNVSVALKEQMGLTVRQKGVAKPPAIPQGLGVQPFANGINRLAWNGNGNNNRTVYVVEQKVSQNGAWRIVGAVTATKFDHTNQTPGRMVVYRVKAKRGAVETAASPETVAYADAAFPLEDE